MIIEFIIRGGPDNDFDIHAGQFLEALRPAEGAFHRLPGFGQDNLDIEVDGVKISFSPEPPGWQMSCSNPPSEAWADQIARSICQNMSRVSGHVGSVVPI